MKVAPYERLSPSNDWNSHQFTFSLLQVQLLCLFVCLYAFVCWFGDSFPQKSLSGFFVRSSLSVKCVVSETRIYQYSSAGFSGTTIEMWNTQLWISSKNSWEGFNQIGGPMFVDPFPTFHFARRSQRVRCSEGCPCLAPGQPPRWGAGGGVSRWRWEQPGVEMCWEPVHTNLAGRHPTPLRPKQSSYPARHT